ncbi:hypothetical protein R6Q59_002269 [Mikania micrantha]
MERVESQRRNATPQRRGSVKLFSSMASSSSCVQNKSYVYDVFLSFCGEDTRKNFVDHLYAALDQQGICTFKDDERLKKGRDISDDLLQSIEESRFYIIVFSKSYASSSWCLNELMRIVECHNTNGHTAFPVFYDVDPSEVRKQSRLVGEALAKLNKNESEVEKWREALTKAANLSGWDVRKIADGHEAKVVKLIVEKVSSELRPVDLNVDENLVGMEKRMKDLELCLEIGSNDVRMIGIKCMGGAGKTTLARAIFDKISFNFEGASFVENVRERNSQSGLKELQQQVLREVLKDNNITVNGVHEGKNLLKKKLLRKKVLVVLDDVDNEEQLEELAGDPNWFNPGSRVIITTRDERVLNTYTVKWIINVTLLSDEEAIRLFSRHAFRRNNPSQGYEMQSHEVVRYAAGLPLTIKVLGSSLRGKNKPEWKDTISRLKKIPLKETLKKLELSYESLEDDYKEIFLDVACFLRHLWKDNAIIVLKSCGFHAINGLRVLEQKSLIRIVGGTYQGGMIQMHDHIVEMGENIVRREHPDEPNKHSRLWIQEEIEHVLANDLGTEATRCIYLKITRGIVLESLEKMKKLRCLIINSGYYNLSDYSVKIDEACQCFLNSLQYLNWMHYPHWCLPKTFEANNLVTLEMTRSKIEQLWNEGRVMKKLKFLFLEFTNLKSLDLGLMPSLERLNLKGCYDLEKLDMHGGCLKSLVYLNLSLCGKLRSLDLGMMPNLERLNLECCYDLEKFDVHGGCLKSLVYLNLSHCRKLKSLDLGMMPNLERLNLKDCYNLEKFDVHGGCLKSLVYLNLIGCPNLKSFLFIEHLESLEVLYFRRCLLVDSSKHYIIRGQSNNRLLELHLSGLDDTKECGLPQKSHRKVDQFESLEKLDLSGYHNFRDMPSNICELKHLKDLYLSGCMRFDKLPDDLEGLKIHRSDVKYQVSEYDDFIRLCFTREPQIQEFKKLRILVLVRCGIEEVPEALGHLEVLEELHLRYTDVKHLPNSICMLEKSKASQSSRMCTS